MPGRDVGDGVERNDPSGELITGDAGDAVAVLVLKDGSGELVATASIGSSLSAGRDRPPTMSSRRAGGMVAEAKLVIVSFHVALGMTRGLVGRRRRASDVDAMQEVAQSPRVAKMKTNSSADGRARLWEI